MSEPVAMAVVGAGRMGRVHLRAFGSTARASLAAIVEPARAAREQVAQLGVPVFETIDQLLDTGGIDGVVITAPSDLHLNLVRRCAVAGLPVFCEKPCGLTAEQARAATAAAEQAEVILQVGYYRRFVPELVALRQRIAEGALGRLSLVSLHQWDEHPPAPEFVRRSGGIVIDMGVHEIDQARWLSGQEVESVVGMTPAAGDESSVAVALRLSAGGLGVITLGRRFPMPDSCWTEVVGTSAHERLPFIWGENGGAVVDRAIASELDAFATAVRSGSPAGPGGADAIAALEVAEMINSSLSDGV